jgi:hypothetical protein
MYTPTNSAVSQPRCLVKTLCVLVMLLAVIGAMPAQASSGFFKNFVILKAGNGADTYYDMNASAANATPNPDFQGAYLGSFNRINGTLLLRGAEANTYNDNGDNITATRIYFRIYRTGDPAGNLQAPMSLPFVSASGNDKIFREVNTVPDINLVREAGAPGNYTVEMYFEGNGNNSGTAFNIYDSNGGTNYTANFTITHTVNGVEDSTGAADPNLTFWTGSGNNDWASAGNWTNGVPTATTSVTFCDKTTRSCILNLAGSVYNVKDFCLEGTDLVNRAVVRMSAGTMNVYGNVTNPVSGLIHNAGEFVLAGGNQTVDTGQFYRLVVSGGTAGAPALKTVTGRIEVADQLRFTSYSMMQAPTTNPSLMNVDLGSTGQLINENSTSYLLGVLRINRDLQPGVSQTFGNCGVDVIINNPAQNAGQTFITRTTGLAYTGVGGHVSIKRIFGIRPTGEDANGITFNQNLDATLIFHYFSTPAELNGNTEAMLSLYRTSNNGFSFSSEGGTADPANQRVIATDVDVMQTFTLAGSDTPLPVNLTAFTAKRNNSAAVLSWNTASETNSRGYEVQVANDALNFRTLGFVASRSANSSSPNSYQFIDDEAKKDGTRYYRLRQLDLDGKESFYGPRVITFGQQEQAADASLSLAAYPNPFASDLRITLQSTEAGQGTYRLSDITGRIIREQSISATAGSNEVSIPGLSELKAGMYVVRFTSPTGTTESVKVQKM